MNDGSMSSMLKSLHSFRSVLKSLMFIVIMQSYLSSIYRLFKSAAGCPMYSTSISCFLTIFTYLVLISAICFPDRTIYTSPLIPKLTLSPYRPVCTNTFYSIGVAHSAARTCTPSSAHAPAPCVCLMLKRAWKSFAVPSSNSPRKISLYVEFSYGSA